MLQLLQRSELRLGCDAQVSDLDCVVVPVSGGGLISGVSVAIKAVNPDIVVLAAEPRGLHPFFPSVQGLLSRALERCAVFELLTQSGARDTWQNHV